MRWKLVVLAIVTASASTIALVRDDSRGVQPKRPADSEAMTPGAGSGEAAALFVGVREFVHEPREVPYAVDDAIDLAYVTALDRGVRLVAPNRVVLALSGQPQKRESAERLEKLRAAGARVEAATSENIVRLVDQQAAAAGRSGTLLLSFASHGFTTDGVVYILGRTSTFARPESAVSAAKVFDTAAHAARSLIFIDACRERVGGGTRSARHHSADPPARLRKLTHRGQVVFYAAAAGQLAYDDFSARNGAFTNAVLAALRCNATRNARGVVTVRTLAEFVEKRLQAWIRKHRDPGVKNAIQVSMDGSTGSMPLADCTPPPNPASFVAEGTSITVSGEDGAKLWQAAVDGEIVHAAIADLDADALREVIVAHGDELTVFDSEGERRWSRHTNVAGGSGMKVRTFTTGRLGDPKSLHIVALSFDAMSRTSRLSVFDDRGTAAGTYAHPGLLQHVLIDGLTSRHEPKIIVGGVNHALDQAQLAIEGAAGVVFMFDPDEIRGEAPPYRLGAGWGSHLWYGVIDGARRIDRIETTDYDNDGKRDITLSTNAGRVHLDFDGRTIATDHALFGLLSPSRPARPAA